MGIFRTFFGRKPAAQPEVWAPPRAEPGLPPIEVKGRVEPGPATPGGYRPAYHDEIDIPEPPQGERWAPDWSDEAEAAAPEPEPEPEPEPPTMSYEPESASIGFDAYPEAVDTAAQPEPAQPADFATEPPAPIPYSAPPPSAELLAILPEIETLGDSPELGLLRQMLGADPDGLFGFSTMYPAALTALLRNRFAGTGALEHLVTRPAWGHHYIVDQRYDFSWKSEVRVGQMEEAEVLAYESDRLTRLRDQLIVNLTENRKLFVYAGPATSEQISNIRAAMRSYGVNTLLHLVIADADHQAGQVTWREAGLLRGYLSRYGSKDGEWDIAIDDWAAVCRAARQRWKPFARP